MSYADTFIPQFRIWFNHHFNASTRFITPDVAVVNVIAEMGAYYPLDDVDRGNNKAGNDRVMLTMVGIKKNGKWLLTNAQGTEINPQIAASVQHQYVVYLIKRGAYC